jgi:hypothetical protein
VLWPAGARVEIQCVIAGRADLMRTMTAESVARLHSRRGFATPRREAPESCMVVPPA